MRHKGLCLVLTVLGILAFSCLSSAAQFEADVQMEAQGQKMDGKVYVMDEKTRMEFTGSAAGGVTITDTAELKAYVLMPEQKMYMEMPLQQQQGMYTYGSGSIEEALEGEAEVRKVGSETISGYECDVYEVEYHDTNLGGSTIWLARKLNYPIKATTKSPQAETTMIYSNIKEGPVDLSLFEIPPDYKEFAY